MTVWHLPHLNAMCSLHMSKQQLSFCSQKKKMRDRPYLKSTINFFATFSKTLWQKADIKNTKYKVHRGNQLFQLSFSFFSSPEQRSRRAIILPPFSVLAASGPTNIKVLWSKFLGPYYFQTLWCIWFMFGMVIDIGPKFYTIPSPRPPRNPLYMILRSRWRT